MIKVVAFDFDDTLYSDTNPRPWREFCSTAAQNLLKFHPIDHLQQALATLNRVSVSDRQLIELLKTYDVPEEKTLRYLKTHKPVGDTFENCTVVPKQTLVDFAKHFNLYIVSNSLKHGVLNNMDRLGIDKTLFRDVLSNDMQSDDKSKTHLYEEILKRESALPNELLVIGNSFHSDILPALNLGAQGRIVNKANFTFHDFFDENLNLRETEQIYESRKI